MKTLRLLPALLVTLVACSGLTDPANDGNSPTASTTITDLAAPEPSATCTNTDNGNGTWAGVAFWGKVTVWGLRFYDATGTLREGPTTHPVRNASGGFSNLVRPPASVDLLGRSGETLLTVACTPA